MRVLPGEAYRAAKRLIMFLLMVALILPFMTFASYADDGYIAEKPIPSRDIAIVYDNSFSMYRTYDYTTSSYSENTAWCRATYAMEVFASMLNEGDSLSIYPMWEIEVGGQRYSKEGRPLTIRGGTDDPSVIRDIFSPDIVGTPITAIDAAYQGLQGSTADEQWLIVLTDGTTFDLSEDSNSQMTQEETVATLTQKLSDYNNSVNVMYLGIGAEAAVPTVSGNLVSEVEKAGDSAEVLEKLTSMGNNIFGRDKLPGVSGGTDSITFDVSLNKLILFVQGDNISGVNLKNESGMDCQPASMFTPSYGTRGGAYNGNVMNTVDDTLSGTIVTYQDLDAGDYTLSYNGDATNVSAYYEPDVRVMVEMLTPEGIPVDPTSDLMPGTYYLAYSLVDKSGEATSSDLLGNVSYEFTCDTNGTQKTISDNAAGAAEIPLEGGDTLNINGKVSYLSGYSVDIQNEDIAGMPPDGLVIPKRDLYVTLSGGEQSYPLSKLEEQAVYSVSLSNDDAPIVGSALDQAEITIDVPGLDYECVRNGDRFDVRLKYNGSAADTECKQYTIHADAKYINEDGFAMESSSEPITFEIEDDTFGLQVEMKVQEGEYILSRMEKAKPILVTISQDGQPLDDEALKAVSLEMSVLDKHDNPVDWSDVLTATPVEGQSQYQIELGKGPGVSAGKYKLNVTATGVDNIGQEITGMDEGTVRIRTVSTLVKGLILLLILLVIAGIIAFFMTRKALPKGIVLDDDTLFYKVGSAPQVTGAADLRYSRKAKSLRIQSAVAPVSNVVVSVTAKLVPVDPRYKPSSKRRVGLADVRFDPAFKGSLSMGTLELQMDKYGVATEPPPEGLWGTLASNDPISVNSKSAQGKTVTFTVNVVYK